MTTTATPNTGTVPAPRPQFAVAGAVLEAIAHQTYDRLADSLAPDATMQALVPRGVREFTGSMDVSAAFHGWFGDVDAFQVLEADLGAVGTRLHLHWRLRVQAERLGAGWFVVEQHVYADTDRTGRISRLRLLCSGFCPE